MVYALSVRGDNFPANLTNDLQYFLVAIHCVLKIDRSIIVCILVGIAALFQLYDTLHQRMVKMMLQAGIICIEISHNLTYCSFCNT